MMAQRLKEADKLLWRWLRALTSRRTPLKERVAHLYETVVSCFWWGAELWAPRRRAHDVVEATTKPRGYIAPAAGERAADSEVVRGRVCLGIVSDGPLVVGACGAAPRGSPQRVGGLGEAAVVAQCAGQRRSWRAEAQEKRNSPNTERPLAQASHRLPAIRERGHGQLLGSRSVSGRPTPIQLGR